MKRFLGFIIMLCLIGCAKSNKQEKNESLRSPLEGTAWELDYSKEIRDSIIVNHLPPNWRRIKMYTNSRWVFTGYDFNKKEVAGMAGGTYTLAGDQYTEKIEFHYHSAFNGKEFKAQLRIEDGYLYQTGKVDSLTLEERWKQLD